MEQDWIMIVLAVFVVLFTIGIVVLWVLARPDPDVLSDPDPLTVIDPVKYWGDEEH